MANITGPGFIGEIDLYQTTTTVPSGYSVGQYLMGVNGKGFRFGLVGASALVIGNALQGAAPADTTYVNMAIGTAAAVGDMFLQVTNGTSTITSAQFEGGTINVYTAGTVAVGEEYTILAVTGTLTTGGALNVWIDRPVRTAFTTSAKVSMRRSAFSGIIQSPITTLTGPAAGVALAASTAATYAFVQTHGQGAVLADNSTILVGSPVAVPSGNAAGAVILGATNLNNIGQAMQVSASGKTIAVHLRVD